MSDKTEKQPSEAQVQLSPALLLLLRTLLGENNGAIRELAPGFCSYYQDRKTHDSNMVFHLAWNPTMWRMGNENPISRGCYLKMEFRYVSDFQSRDNTGSSLLRFLTSTFTPLQPGLEFHKDSKFLKLTEVAAHTPDPLSMSAE